MNLSQFDIVIILFYFALVIGLGIVVVKRDATAEDYFLAGRTLTWPVIGFSLFASNISSTTLIGLTGAAYLTGISISNYEWMAAIVLVFFAVFFIPCYLRSKIYTMPEYLERRFSPSCRRYFSALTILGNILIDTAGTLYAGSLVIQLFFPDISLIASALVLALMAGVYTSVGGLAAVVYTDALQAVVLMFGSLVLTFFALDAVGSWNEVVANTPAKMLSLIQPNDDPTMPWLGTLIGVPILGFYFWCTNQFIVQRILAAKSVSHARWGALFAGFLKLPVLFFMVFPGVMARKLYPELPRADLVFPTMVSDLLPVGIKGLVLAGLLAAIMSSIDSTLNSASTLLTMDFIRVYRPKISTKALAKIGRISTLAVMLFSALWVPVVAQSLTLFEYLQSALSYLFPPVVAVFVLGMFWRRASSAGAFAGLVSGHLLSLTVFVLQNTTNLIPEIHFLVLAGMFFAASTLVCFFVSIKSSKPSSEQTENYCWHPQDSIPEYSTPWIFDYRIQSAGLILLTMLMVWNYR